MPRQFFAACVFLAFLALLISSRLPFLSNTLVGEEGNFAAFVADPVEPSTLMQNHIPQMLIAKIDGEPIYAPITRNIVPYLLIERGPGSLWRELNIFSLEPQQRTQWIRTAFFALFLVGVVAMAAWASWLATASQHALLGLAVLAFGLTTPLVVGASIQPQLDGSVGIMLLGLAAFLLVSAGLRGVADMLRFGAAGVLVGLGRHEWPMAVAFSALAVLLLCLILGSRSWRQCLVLTAGVGLGTALSVLVSPANYEMGIGVMNRIYALQNDRLQILLREMGFLWPLLALLILSFVLIFVRLKSRLDENPGAVITAFSAAAIALGFAISGWPGDGFPRYYAPAIVLSCFAAVALILREGRVANSRYASIAIAVVCLGLGVDLYDLARANADGVSITSSPGAQLDDIRNEMRSLAEKAAKTHGIAFTHGSIWVYEPGTDFISRDIGWDDAKRYLASMRAGLDERLVRPSSDSD